jgi:phosphoenolpyruvate carboxylase
MLETRYQNSFAKTVQKKMKTQKNFDNRDKAIKDTVDDLQTKMQRKHERLHNHIEEERRNFKDKIHGMNKKIKKVEDIIEQQRQMASEMLSGKVEKKRLTMQDTLENDRRIKLMRQNFNTQMMLRH